MKAWRLLLTLFLVIGLASCGDDDGDSNGGQDRIVGKWSMQSLTIDGEAIEITECEAQSSITFSANGNVTFTDFFEEFETEECVSESYSENWENRGNNVYRFSDEGESYDVTIIFSNNNNIFTVTEEDEDGTYVVRYERM